MVLTAATSESVTAVLTVLGTIATWMFEQLSAVVTIVMENPLLLIPIGIVITYAIINVFKRLF